MKKVLLLYGGMSTEHDVSLSSAKSILDNYDTNLFEITPVYIDKNNNWCLNNSKIDNIISFLKEFDIVFPIIHGYGGEDGKLAGLLDMFDIKYVGSGVLSSAIGMDKEIAKIIFNYLNNMSTLEIAKTMTDNGVYSGDVNGLCDIRANVITYGSGDLTVYGKVGYEYGA